MNDIDADPAKHKARHVLLHSMLMTIVAMPRPAHVRTVMDLLRWSSSDPAPPGSDAHRALDELAADFVIHNRIKLFSRTSIDYFVEWSESQTRNPTPHPEL